MLCEWPAQLSTGAQPKLALTVCCILCSMFYVLCSMFYVLCALLGVGRGSPVCYLSQGPLRHASGLCGPFLCNRAGRCCVPAVGPPEEATTVRIILKEEAHAERRSAAVAALGAAAVL